MYKDSVTDAVHPPARECIKSRSAQSHARPKIEAGVVQGTAQLIADDQPLCEGTMVMRTASPNSKEFICLASQNHVLVPDSALDHSAIL